MFVCMPVFGDWWRPCNATRTFNNKGLRLSYTIVHLARFGLEHLHILTPPPIIVPVYVCLQIEAICKTQLEEWSAAGTAVDLVAEGKALSFEFSTQLLVGVRVWCRC